MAKPDIKRKIRVMHVISSRAMGGTERMLTHMIPHFDTQSFESCLTCFNSPSFLTEEWEKAGINVFHLYSDKSLSFNGIFRITALIQKWKPDILCIYGLRANLMTRLAAWWCHTPVVVTGQRGIEDWKTLRHVVLERLTSPLVDLYIGNSKACCQMLATREGIPRRQLHTIPNGIHFQPPPDINTRVQSIRSKHHLPDDVLIVGTVGRLQPIKGHHDFIQAAKIILKQHPETFFVLVGEDNRNRELQALAAEMGINEHVCFAGYSQEVAAWLELFDIYVQPSLSEGMPVAVLEAMFMSLPVIATKVGGTPEVVIDGETGLLIPPAHPEQMANSIIQLLNNFQQRKQLGSAGHQRAKENFTVQIMVERYQNVFIKLLEKKTQLNNCLKREH